MPEQFAEGVNGIDVCYETFGPPDGEPLLLIMGLSAPMIWWDEELCQLLVERGFHVIRFDNRDCGRSSSIGGSVSLPAAYLGRKTAYALDDMSDDGAALLTRLGISSAHVVGASLGGMIGQLLAIRHPGRVRSLTSIMSHTGNRLVWRPHRKAMATLLTAPPRDREGYITSAWRASSARPATRPTISDCASVPSGPSSAALTGRVRRGNSRRPSPRRTARRCSGGYGCRRRSSTARTTC